MRRNKSLWPIIRLYYCLMGIGFMAKKKVKRKSRPIIRGHLEKVVRFYFVGCFSGFWGVLFNSLRHSFIASAMPLVVSEISGGSSVSFESFKAASSCCWPRPPDQFVNKMPSIFSVASFRAHLSSAIAASGFFHVAGRTRKPFC